MAEITIATIAGQVSGVAFPVAGSCALTPLLKYTDVSGTAFAALPSGVVASGSVNWSFTHPGLAPGSHTVLVEDANTGSVTTSNTFSVVAHTITPHAPSGTVAGAAFTFSGSLSGYTSAPSLTYKIDSGTFTSLSGVVASGWSTSLTAPASGSHTITVSDGTVSGSASFTTAAAASGTVVTWNPSDKASSITLSNANKSAASTVTTSTSVRATQALPASGAVAWEVKMDVISADWTTGVADGTMSLTLPAELGSDAHGIGAYPSTGPSSQPPQSVFYNNNALVTGSDADASGDIMSIVVSGTNFWFSTPAMRLTSGVTWNGDSAANPATGAGGLSFTGIGTPRYPVFNTVENGSKATINGGDTAFSTFLTTYLAAHTAIKSLGGSVAPPVSGSGVFTVSGGVIIGPDGNPFIARGIAVDAGDLAARSTSASGTPLLTLFPGCNYVRVAVQLSDDNGGAYNFSLFPPSSFTTFVAQLTAKKIVVNIENHAFPQTNSVQTGTQLTAEAGWYAALASGFAGNPYVWFSSPNEPLVNGGAGSQAQATVEQVAVYNAIRGAGNNNIILMEVIGGGVVSYLGTSPSSGFGLVASGYAGMHNVAWDLHAYAGDATDTSAFASDIAASVALAQEITSADGVMPVIIGEYGNSQQAVSVDTEWLAYCEAVQGSGLGCAAWTWANSGNDVDNLVNTTTLTDYGEQVAGFIAS